MESIIAIDEARVMNILSSIMVRQSTDSSSGIDCQRPHYVHNNDGPVVFSAKQDARQEIFVRSAESGRGS